MKRHRRRTRLFTRWTKRGRQQAALDAARVAEEAEQRAARRRVLEAATELVPVVRPASSWRPARRPAQSTELLPKAPCPAPVWETPLLTPGQTARSRRPR